MPPKKKDKDQIRVKQFKDGSNNWWCGGRHFKILEGKLVMCAGGMPDEEVTKKMENYLKRKKVDFD